MLAALTVLVCPSPIPNLVDSCHHVVEGKVSHRELLVTPVATVQATIECEVGDETTATFFDEDALMLCACDS